MKLRGGGGGTTWRPPPQKADAFKSAWLREQLPWLLTDLSQVPWASGSEEASLWGLAVEADTGGDNVGKNKQKSGVILTPETVKCTFVFILPYVFNGVEEQQVLAGGFEGGRKGNTSHLRIIIGDLVLEVSREKVSRFYGITYWINYPTVIHAYSLFHQGLHSWLGFGTSCRSWENQRPQWKLYLSPLFKQLHHQLVIQWKGTFASLSGCWFFLPQLCSEYS